MKSLIHFSKSVLQHLQLQLVEFILFINGLSQHTPYKWSTHKTPKEYFHFPHSPLAQKCITSKQVESVMLAVDRKHFVPNPDFAYDDSPHNIGFNQVISAPHLVNHPTHTHQWIACSLFRSFKRLFETWNESAGYWIRYVYREWK